MSSSSFLRRPAVLLALALGGVAALVSVIGSLVGGSRSGMKTIPLVSVRGAEAYSSFSPDGKRLVYAVRRASVEAATGQRSAKDEHFDLFVRELPYGNRFPITESPGSDVGPAWSPDGRSVAFLRVGEEKAECMVVPAEGGAARKVADCRGTAESGQYLPAVAWTPDGKSLAISTAAGEKDPPAIALVPAAGGEPKRITEPPRGTQGDSTPAISADGKSLAFVRHAGEEGRDIFVCELSSCNPRRITFDAQPVRGIVWMTDNRNLIYGGQRMGRWRLWRISAAGGDPRDAGISGRQAQFPAVMSGGGRLAFTESPSVSAIWRAPLGGEADAPGAPIIRSSGREWSPSYSPDGLRIASLSDQTGADEIWVSDANGGNRVQVTHFKGTGRPSRPRWSPDGKSIVFELAGTGVPSVQIIAASGGEPRRVVADGGAPSWSHDGKSIYYSARGEIWKAGAGGTNPHQLTNREGGPGHPNFMRTWPEESADGKSVYYRAWGSIYRVPAEGGNEEEVAQLDMSWAGVQFAPKGVYFSEWRRALRRQVISFYDFASRQTTLVFRAADASGFAVSPDGKSILYPRVDRSDTSLMLVEGFK